MLTTILAATSILASTTFGQLPWLQTRQLTSSAESLAAVMATFHETNDFDGVVQVRVNSDLVYANWSGKADEEAVVAMGEHSVFPVGSNSKLFTSVALYQLQERGLVNLTEPVNAHLTQEDFAKFGFPNQTTWCPRVYGAASDSPCESITFVQFLHMSSGIGKSIDCNNVDAAHCYRSANDLAYYKGSIGPYVGRVINDPLVYKPGSNYSYSNAGYVLLSYLGEKLSGMALEKYFQTEIFDKVGLTETSYDPFAGGFHIHKGRVREYNHYYLKPSNGAKKAELLSTGTCAPVFNDGAISGAGGVWSSVPDMQRWYLDLFENRGMKSKVLTEASIRMILERVNPTNPLFAQGIAVEGWRADKWPTKLAYCGSVKCTNTCMGMLFPENSTDSSFLMSAFSNHLHYVFKDHSAFEKFRPTEFLYLEIHDETLDMDDGGAEALMAPLAQAQTTTL